MVATPTVRKHGRAVPTAEAKAKVISLIAEGHTVKQAMDSVAMHVKTYENWRRVDLDFASGVDRIRTMRQVGTADRQFMEFPEFSDRYFGARVFPHMQNVVDLIEGRDPAWQPPGIVYERREQDLVMATMPPEHGKSTTITVNYVAYRIAMNPNIRVIIVSKTQTMAKKFLFGVKERLTHRQYADMIAAYAPPGGFDKDSAAWKQEMIYISPDARDAGEKDPTVEALGVRGHIYGARADLIILDDCVDHTNAHEYDKQIDWIQSQVMSRLSDAGALLVVGTRIAARDLYSELLKEDYYPEDESPWTHLSMPAVLEFADDPVDWVTLWPRSNMATIGAKGDRAEADGAGLFPKWDGPALSRRRARMTPANWARIYMQQQGTEDMVFHPDAVRGCLNMGRKPGLIPAGGLVGVREQGMDGLLMVAGLDPASPSGYVGAVVIGLDLLNQRRYVLDIHNKTRMVPEDIRDLIKAWTDKYNIAEWRIEKNAFQTMLTQDREINQFLATRGCVLREHTTGQNKWDEDYGVASLSTLFFGWERGQALIELPATHQSEAAKALVEQLTTWAPKLPKHQRTDIVMALWFAELACRDRVQSWTRFGTHHQKNPFATRWDLSQRHVVDLRELEQRRAFTPIGA